MMKEQYLADFDPGSQSSLQIVLQKTIAGIKYAFLIAGIALVSIILVSFVSIIFNVFHLFHTLGVLPRVNELEASPGYILYLWFIVMCVGVFAVLLAAWWSIEPIYILRYMRQLKREEKQYAELYIPLKVLPADPTSGTYIGREDLSQELDLMAWAQPQQDRHLLLLGPRGSGKTMFLHVYQGNMLQQLWKIIFGQQRIPVFVSMGTYNNFLSDELVDFLRKRVPEMHHLHRYLQKLMKQGRLLLLCDDVNEISSRDLDVVCGHLISLMDDTQNRLIITCQEVDYNEQEHIRDLVTNGNALLGSIRLPQNQIEAFIHKYLERQSDTWRHSAEQIFQVINWAHLIPLCNNPSSLLTLMQVIDQVGIEGEHILDTRGLLAQEFVLRKIDTELKGEWSNAGLTREEVLQFLSELAYIMRWAGDRNEVDFSLSLEEGSLDYEVLADEILDWLITQRPQEPFIATQDVQPGLFHDALHKRKRARLLQFARSIGFITVSLEGVLSFKQKLIADYLVAKYLYFLTEDNRWQTLLLLNETFLSEETIERWREPFALWAGLVADPAPLVDRIAQVGQRDLRYAAPALMLSFVCLGAKRRRHTQQEVHLPLGVRQMLVGAVDNKNARKKLAPVFDRCAAEMGQWVYETLLPLLTTKGVGHLMVLLNKKIVPKMLFLYLEQIADNVHYNARKEPLISILRQFGSQGCEDVILMAAELSQPAHQRSLQLRKAAIDILGYTQDKQVVKPLMLLLQDSQAEIIDASSRALAQLGPNLVLEPLIEELRHADSRAHIPVLGIVGNFLTTRHQEFLLKNVEYLRVLEELVPVLSSNYPQEARECACELLKKLVQGTTDESKQSREKIVALLLQQLEFPDKVLGNNVVQVLNEVGEFATPYLLDHLRHQLSPIVRRRIVEVFSHVRDPRALDALLFLVADPSDEVFYQVKFALQHYAGQYPECITRLIKLVLDNISNDVADRATEVLGDLRDDVVEPVIEALPAIKDRRTEKLVHVLEKRRDERAIPALIDLLNMPQVRNDTSLALTVISALGEFRDERVVPALLKVLASSDNQLFDDAVDVLSNLGEIAFKQLIATLNVQQEMEGTLRIRQALIRMKTPLDGKPFHVDEELFKIFSTCGEELARQIQFIFRERGVDAAQVLIQHIPERDILVRGRVLWMLYAMDKSDVIPAFVTALRRLPPELDPELLSAATQYLTQSDESIPSLVSALRDTQCDAISTILLKFGPKLLHTKVMIVGLNDEETRERLQHIIKTLGLQQPEEVVAQIIDLFSLIKDKNQNLLAYTVLVDLLAGDLAEQSVHYLIEALEKPEVVDGVADALHRLAGHFEARDEVINGLIQSLRSDKRRNGAKETLVRLGDKAVYHVGDLIADNDLHVASAAQEILTRIGSPAFPVIWSALSDIDTRNPGRQGAGRNILCAMPTHVIKDKLIELLSSDKAADIEMAVTLLLELIQNEPRRPSGNQKMIPALLASIQEKSAEHKKLRILTLLLLWGGSDVAESLVQTLRNNPQFDEQLAQAFLLLRKETAEKKLQDVVQGKTGPLPPQLRAQLVGILGMIKPDLVSTYARNIAAYGLVSGGGGQVKNPDQLAVSLRALGALLTNGSWNIWTLPRMREYADVGTPQRELFDILLGDLYSPRIKAIEQQKEAETEKNRQLEGELGQLKKVFQEVSGNLQQTQGALQGVSERLKQAENERDQAKEEAGNLRIAIQGLILNQQLQAGTGESAQGPGVNSSSFDWSRFNQQ